MSALVEVIDDVLLDPLAYRAAALALRFESIALGDQVFHGIAGFFDRRVTDIVERQRPGTVTVASFFRRSPEGQVEPNMVHADDGMGDWTGILYLNPDPPASDGTSFWRHRPTGATSGNAWQRDGHDLARWERWQHVPARFNRLLLFSAPLYHSRGMEANYGAGDGARLIQVVFARGAAA